jgi:hypothetical protein
LKVSIRANRDALALKPRRIHSDAVAGPLSFGCRYREHPREIFAGIGCAIRIGIKLRNLSVQIERIRATKRRLKERGEFVKRDGLAGDDEDDVIGRNHADAAADTAVGGIGCELGIDLAVDEEQGAGLGGQAGFGGERWILARFDDRRAVVADEENAVGFQVEIAGAGFQIERDQFPVIFDVQAAGREGGIEDPRVGCENDAASRSRERCVQLFERSDARAIGSVPARLSAAPSQPASRNRVTVIGADAGGSQCNRLARAVHDHRADGGHFLAGGGAVEIQRPQPRSAG